MTLISNNAQTESYAHDGRPVKLYQKSVPEENGNCYQFSVLYQVLNKQLPVRNCQLPVAV